MAKTASLATGTQRQLSLFEKLILVNTLVLVGEALAGLWITSHNLEVHHYLIDTAFIVATTLFTLGINFVLLRASFSPLFSLIRTMRAISTGQTNKRASIIPTDSEIGELAQAFNTMLDQLEAMRRQQAMLILQAQEEERRRLARELHDESSQNLTALLVHIEILHQTLQQLPPPAIQQRARDNLQAGLQHLEQLTKNTLENVRTLALQLRPGVLDDLGLQATFRWLAEDCQQRLKLPVKLELDNVEPILREQDNASLYETTLFRIAQECLTNAARHAQATHVSISLKQQADSILLRVQDDGRGYDKASTQTGLGIAGMRERAALLGGKVTISSEQGRGTTVEAILPLANVKEAAHAN